MVKLTNIKAAQYCQLRLKFSKMIEQRTIQALHNL